MTPRVSIVIVSYRSREPLQRCLESLRRAVTELPLEVIVIDNASGDGTVEWIAHAHPEVRVIANAENVGFTRAVNQGLACATAEALLLLNPDCELRPGALTRLLGGLDCDAGTAAAAPLLLDETGAAARSCGQFPTLWTLVCDHLGLARAFPDTMLFGGYKYGGTPVESLNRVDWASGAALMLHRDAYRDIGGLDENIFMFMEEVDWCRRAALAGWRTRLVPEARIVHAGQHSSRQVPGPSYQHNLRSRVYYFRKHYGAGAALVAKLILATSLALKWCAASGRRRAMAPLYAAGIRTVWSAAWR